MTDYFYAWTVKQDNSGEETHYVVVFVEFATDAEYSVAKLLVDRYLSDPEDGILSTDWSWSKGVGKGRMVRAEFTGREVADRWVDDLRDHIEEARLYPK